MSSSILHLIHRAQQAATLAFGMRAPVTASQAVVLLAIAGAPGCSQTDLVKATGIDRSTMADIVRRLLGQGLVLRKRSKADARRYVLALSEKGERAVAVAQRALRASEDDMLARVPERHRTGFRKALEAIASGEPALVAAE